MNKLHLPLHCYDEAGRILPSTWFNLIFFWGARGLIVLVAALIMGDRGTEIPSIIFPNHIYLKFHLILGAGFLGLWLVSGRREWFWKHNYPMTWLRPALVLHLLIDVAMQTVEIVQTAKQFSPLKGSMLLISLFALVYILRSKRTHFMFLDWRTKD